MAQVKDPVCGMTIDSATAREHASFEGREFHFCSAGCKQKFEANPKQYAGKA